MHEQQPHQTNEQTNPNPEDIMQEKINAVYESVSPAQAEGYGDEAVKLISSKDVETHEAALQQIDTLLTGLDQGAEIPESLQIKRDWSDNLRGHNDKQRAHIESVGDSIVAGLVKRSSVEEKWDNFSEKRHEKKLRQAKINDHNQAIDLRNAEKANRQDLAERERQRLQLRHGERYMQIFKDEIDQEVAERVEEKLGPAPLDPHSVSIASIKKVSKEQKEGRVSNHQATVDAIRAFRREGAEKSALHESHSETRSKVDYSLVDDYRAYLESSGAPTSDIFKDIPLEVFFEGKTNDEIARLMPKSYWEWQESRSDRDRDLVSKDENASQKPAISPDSPVNEVPSDASSDLIIGLNGKPIGRMPRPAVTHQINLAPGQALEDQSNTKHDDLVQNERRRYGLGTRINAKVSTLFLTAQEKLGKRKGLAAAAVGVLAVGLLVAKSKGWIPFDNDISGRASASEIGVNEFSTTNPGVLDQGTLRDAGSEAISTPSGGGNSGAPEAALEAAPQTVRLGNNGNTIWQHAEQALREQGIENPTDKQIVKKTQSILMSNGLTWQGARSLPIGFRLKI